MFTASAKFNHKLTACLAGLLAVLLMSRIKQNKTKRKKKQNLIGFNKTL